MRTERGGAGSVGRIVGLSLGAKLGVSTRLPDASWCATSRALRLTVSLNRAAVACDLLLPPEPGFSIAVVASSWSSATVARSCQVSRAVRTDSSAEPGEGAACGVACFIPHA